MTQTRLTAAAKQLAKQENLKYTQALRLVQVAMGLIEVSMKENVRKQFSKFEFDELPEPKTAWIEVAEPKVFWLCNSCGQKTTSKKHDAYLLGKSKGYSSMKDFAANWVCENCEHKSVDEEAKNLKSVQCSFCGIAGSQYDLDNCIDFADGENLSVEEVISEWACDTCSFKYRKRRCCVCESQIGNRVGGVCENCDTKGFKQCVTCSDVMNPGEWFYLNDTSVSEPNKLGVVLATNSHVAYCNSDKYELYAPERTDVYA